MLNHSFRSGQRNELYYEAEIEVMRPNESNTMFIDFEYLRFFRFYLIETLKFVIILGILTLFYVMMIIGLNLTCRMSARGLLWINDNTNIYIKAEFNFHYFFLTMNTH